MPPAPIAETISYGPRRVPELIVMGERGLYGSARQNAGDSNAVLTEDTSVLRQLTPEDVGPKRFALKSVRRDASRSSLLALKPDVLHATPTRISRLERHLSSRGLLHAVFGAALRVQSRPALVRTDWPDAGSTTQIADAVNT